MTDLTKLPIPDVRYICAACREPYRQDELNWSESVNQWICPNCWWDKHGIAGPILSDVIEARKKT